MCSSSNKAEKQIQFSFLLNPIVLKVLGIAFSTIWGPSVLKLSSLCSSSDDTAFWLPEWASKTASLFCSSFWLPEIYY